MHKEQVNWKDLYKEVEHPATPWFYPVLSPDLIAELELRGITRGTFLDLGTGAGTQAAGLYDRGFDVVATDISADSPLPVIREGYPQVQFIQDDILRTNLDISVDYIWDRGCFHNFDPPDRRAYVENAYRLLRENGILFLKCFSHKQERIRPTMPYTFSPEQIRMEFEPRFRIDSWRETILRGSLNPLALFIVLIKR